jgi:hypothetical protein
MLRRSEAVEKLERDRPGLAVGWLLGERGVEVVQRVIVVLSSRTHGCRANRPARDDRPRQRRTSSGRLIDVGQQPRRVNARRDELARVIDAKLECDGLRDAILMLRPADDLGREGSDG